MITFDLDSFRFTYRVVAVCIHDGHVLLHREETGDFWTLPGGRCEFGEASDEALRREMMEELGVTVAIGRLLWVVENIFAHTGTKHHEIGLYYAVDFPAGHAYYDTTQIFNGIEEHPAHEQVSALIYQWFPIARVPKMIVFPLFLRTAFHDLPTTMQHIVNREY